MTDSKVANSPAPQAAPQALGYIGIRTKDLGDWATYGSRLLGLQRIDKSRATLAFRMDDRKQRLLVEADGGAGIGFSAGRRRTRPLWTRSRAVLRRTK
jgi:hypothetical protein